MKRFLRNLSVLMLVAAGTGCQLQFAPAIDETEQNGVGSLVVSIAVAGSRTLLPPIDLSPASYLITGAGPGNRTFTQNASAGQVTIPQLANGPWLITVEALNAEGTIVGRGVGSVKVNSGKTVSLQVLVLPLEGFGSLRLAVSWNAAETDDPLLIARLLPVSGAPLDLSFSPLGPGLASCNKSDIATGCYTLTVELRDGGELVAGTMEIALIVKDQATSGTYDFTRIDATAGKIGVNISPEPADPITVSLTGQQAVLSSGASMTVAASVPPDAGNVSCLWFLDGASQAIGNPYTVGAGLDPGNHLLEAAVFSADGKRTGLASHPFRVEAAAPPVQATLEWDPNGEPDLAGYRLHYGLASGSYTTVVDVGRRTAFTLTGLTAGAVYYVAATAYNSSGRESTFSNEVVFTGSP